MMIFHSCAHEHDGGSVDIYINPIDYRFMMTINAVSIDGKKSRMHAEIKFCPYCGWENKVLKDE